MAKSEKKRPVERFDPALERPILQWSSPDRTVYSKSPSWYLAVIFVAVLLAFILYKQQLWSGVILVLTAAIAIMTLSSSKSHEIKCSVYAQGVVADDKVYRYSDFKSFWITYVDLPKARFQLSGFGAGQVVMPLSSIDIDQVRLYLSKHLPEDDKKGEDLVDIVNKLLKF